MIVGIGMCMLVIGLIGIVILQIFRSQLLEGFRYDGAVTPDCKLHNRSQINDEDYKDWCDRYSQCKWDDTGNDCTMNPEYTPPADVNSNPCDGPCSSIGSESTCNGCAKCVTCVGEVDYSTTTSDNKCIDKSEYSKEKCPNTLPFDMGGNDDDYRPSSSNDDSSSSSSNDDYNPSSSNDDYNSSSSPPSYCKEPCNSIGVLNGACASCPNCKTCMPNSDTTGRGYCATPNEECPPGTYEKHATGLLPSTPEEREARHRRRREMIDSGDTMDYTMEDSEESAKAKEKNSESKFLRDFQSIVRNELLNEQGMTTANSQEYLRDKARRRRENMKPNQKRGCPDMSEYVRKDSIPCWGCTLE